jgi:hypothetical protein
MLTALIMTTIRQVLSSCGLVLVSVVGCASHPGEANETIDYQWTGQIGAASAHIDTDGTFTRTKRDGSTDTGQLSAAVLDDLQSEVDQAQFPTLEARYGCGGCLDQPVHAITVHVNGATYTVRADDGSDYPARLQPLIDRLQALALETLP